MKTPRFVVLAVLAGLAGITLAQPTAQPGTNTADPLDPQPNGPRHRDPTHHVLLNATVHTEPGITLDHAVIEIQDGLIWTVLADAADFEPPAGAQVHDLTGMHIYAGFIDAHLPIDVPKPSLDSPGTHWNASVTPQRSALDAGGIPDAEAEALRSLGFTAAAIAPKGGIFTGRSAVVSLAQPPTDPADGKPPVYAADVYQAMSFRRNGTNRGEFGNYPNSQMGAIALIRQTLSDADWYARTDFGPPDESCFSSLTTDLPLLFRTRDELEGLRAIKVAREFGRPFIVLGSGTEFRRLDAIASNLDSNNKQPTYILPLSFPKTPEIDTIGKADSTNLRTLMTWEQAPTNPRRLDEAGVTVCLTASGLRKGEKFDANLRDAIKLGSLPPDRALAMLTTHPAALLGVEDSLGTIEPFKIANLIITSGNLFTQSPGLQSGDNAEILDVWIDGTRHTINDPPPPFDGTWTFRVGEFFEMKLIIDGNKITGIESEGDDASEGPARKVSIKDTTISFLIDDTDDGSGTYVISGILTPDGTIRGTGLGADNNPFEWTATKTEPDITEPDAQARNNEDTTDGDAPDADAEAAEASDENADDTNNTLPPIDLPGYPFGPYATTILPPQQTVIFHNATIWTSGPDGIIHNGWMMIESAVIRGIGHGDPPQAEGNIHILDLQGKHITPGLIDAHSHTGISRGVNESGQAVTAEVRISDVTNPDSINWYRQLAGGVTTVNNMHGSANPIGGQTQTNKVRWGITHPDDMHMQGAKPGIKFALGENVKQSNWESPRTRYPQTRMGVETLIRDRFIAAQEYLLHSRGMRLESTDFSIDNDGAVRFSVEASISLRKSETVRRDLELEALAEILAGERLIHCHSYRQDEILMLCRIAEEFGFKIGTFQHGLEVYKVAEAVRENAIGASLFSDWWAYKVEVQDAIAQAGPLQTEVGVLTSYNSDSDELSRRMNVEAAKAYKYSDGRLSKEDALKFVTINPAIQLGIDSRVGSIEVGKDADLAIWSGEPLSSFSMCEATWIDGREYFSLERDAALRAQNAAHRTRITQKILTKSAPKPKSEDDKDEDADAEATEASDAPPRGGALRAPSLTERMASTARTSYYLDLYLRGIHPADHRCGDCGNTELQLGGNQ